MRGVATRVRRRAVRGEEALCVRPPTRTETCVWCNRSTSADAPGHMVRRLCHTRRRPVGTPLPAPGGRAGGDERTRGGGRRCPSRSARVALEQRWRGTRASPALPQPCRSLERPAGVASLLPARLNSAASFRYPAPAEPCCRQRPTGALTAAGRRGDAPPPPPRY